MEGGQNSNVIRTAEEVDSNFDGFETSVEKLYRCNGNSNRARIRSGA